MTLNALISGRVSICKGPFSGDVRVQYAKWELARWLFSDADTTKLTRPSQANYNIDHENRKHTMKIGSNPTPIYRVPLPTSTVTACRKNRRVTRSDRSD
jgi:hypothetical protein